MNEHLNTPVKKIAFTGLFTALVFVLTIIIRIPSPTGGYVNIGDAAVLASGVILGPIYGAFAAGVGSALTDVVGGYLTFAPGTLVIKAVMAVVAALLYKKCKNSNPMLLLAFALCELIMVGGYFLYDAFLLHITGESGSWAAAFIASAAEITGNLLQAIIGIVGAIMLRKLFEDILVKIDRSAA